MPLENAIDAFNTLVKRASNENWAHKAESDKQYGARLEVIRDLASILTPDNQPSVTDGIGKYHIDMVVFSNLAEDEKQWRLIKVLWYLKNTSLMTAGRTYTLSEEYKASNWIKHANTQLGNYFLKGLLFETANMMFKEFDKLVKIRLIQAAEKNNIAMAPLKNVVIELAKLKEKLNALHTNALNNSEALAVCNQSFNAMLSALHALRENLKDQLYLGTKKLIIDVLHTELQDTPDDNIAARLIKILKRDDIQRDVKFLLSPQLSATPLGSRCAGVLAGGMFSKDGINLKSGTFEALLTSIGRETYNAVHLMITATPSPTPSS